MTSFDYWLIGSMFVLLMINTIVQFKLGFTNGARGGYTVGMYHAVSWLMKNKHLECENSNTGKSATPAEVVALIIRSKSFLNHKIDDEELKKITEATEEINK